MWVVEAAGLEGAGLRAWRHSGRQQARMLVLPCGVGCEQVCAVWLWAQAAA